MEGDKQIPPKCTKSCPAVGEILVSGGRRWLAVASGGLWPIPWPSRRPVFGKRPRSPEKSDFMSRNVILCHEMSFFPPALTPTSRPRLETPGFRPREPAFAKACPAPAGANRYGTGNQPGTASVANVPCRYEAGNATRSGAFCSKAANWLNEESCPAPIIETTDDGPSFFNWPIGPVQWHAPLHEQPQPSGVPLGCRRFAPWPGRTRS